MKQWDVHLGKRNTQRKENAAHLGTLSGTFFMLSELGAPTFILHWALKM